MSDTSNTQSNNDDTSKKKFDSPWDEELPPEEPKAAKVVGSLDPRSSDLSVAGGDKKPVPFNIPTNVADEKVGKKIPAQAVIDKSNALSVNKTNVPPTPPAVQNISQSPIKPVQTQPLKPIEPKPIVLPVAKSVPQPVQNKAASTPVSSPANPPAPSKADIKQNPNLIPLPTTAKPTPAKESGVNELIQPKSSSTFVSAVQEEIKPLQPVTNISAAPVAVKNQPTKPVSIILPPKPEAKIEPARVVLPAAPAEKVPIYPAPVAKLEPKSEAMADIKPATKLAEEPAPPILPDISKPADLAKEDELKPPSYITNRSKPVYNNQDQKKPAPPEIRKPIRSNEPPFYKKIKFLIPAVAVFLLVLGIYLTEAGILGIGLEKVYGLTGVESLWGGLSKNPEKALGVSTQAMQKQLNFKIKGSISMTVNKTIESPITSPLVSTINLPFVFRDTNTLAGIKSITTQYDYYGTGDTSESDTTDESTTDTSVDSTTETDSSTSTDTSTSADTSTDTSTSILGDQNSDAEYLPEESTIKQIDADIEGQSSDSAIKTDLVIKKLVGSGSTVSILNTKNQLFVRSSQDIKFASNAEPSKWLEFNLNSIQNENPFKDLTGIKFDQGFSIIGRRSGNEKVGSIRCYKYSIDNLEIGDSLDFLGIKKDSIQKIEGNIWIGVADHYLHKIDLKIIPSISSSISQMSITLEMYDFGIENSIQTPALTDKIVANVTVDPNATATTATTTVPSVAAAVTMEGRDQTRKADLQNVKVALEKYKTANGKFPIANAMVHLDSVDNLVQKALVSEYSESLPIDPKASEGWFYGYKSDGKSFILSARLENSADKEVTRVGDIYLHWVYNN